MIRIIIRSFVMAIPTLIVASIIIFGLLIIGGNPLEQLKQNPAYTSQDITRITKEYGWDKPPVQQYFAWAGNAVHGDFGKSLLTHQPALVMIKERLPLTLMLMGSSLIISLLIAIPLGSYVAVKKYSGADYGLTFMTFILMATPSFFIGLLLQLMALKMQDANGGNMIFSTAGAPSCVGSTAGFFHTIFSCAQDPAAVIKHLALPVLCLSILQIAGWMRYQRAELLNVLNQEYMKTAIAKGIPGRRVFLMHAMRNSMLPIVTIVGIDMAMLFSGAVITEQVFGLPGMGNLLLDSISNRDIVVVQAIVMISALLVLFFNLAVDIFYSIADPRVRLS